MKLYFRKYGNGKPLIVLHGLFGMGDNWSTMAKSYAENNFSVYLVDLRNHGRSPHSPEFSYEKMAEDVFELLQTEHIDSANLIGHSLGGKVAMFLAAAYPDQLQKMVIADMAPRYYPPHHQSIIAALHAVRIDEISSRKEAEDSLRTAIKDEATIQFLLKNIFWSEEKLEWRFGLSEIENNMVEIGKAFKPDHTIMLPVLFLRGGKSEYINKDDESEINTIFLNAQIETIPGAGHWLHAEKPKEFLQATLKFFN